MAGIEPISATRHRAKPNVQLLAFQGAVGRIGEYYHDGARQQTVVVYGGGRRWFRKIYPGLIHPAEGCCP